MSRGIRVGISERLLGECIQKNNELTQENYKLKQENEDLYDTVGMLTDEYKRRLLAEEKITALEQQIHSFALEVKRLEQKSDDWESKYYDCRNGYNAYVEISQNLQQQLESEIKILEKENERAEESNTFLRGLNEALEEKNDKLIKQLGSKVICGYEKGI